MKERAHGIAVIRSGGQAGADRGALDAARQTGFPICGWCPRGGRAEDMPEPPGLLVSYPELAEAPSPDPIVRTEWNVRDSDATLIVCPGPISSCSGTAATVEFAKSYGKPFYVSDGTDYASVLEWIAALSNADGKSLDLNVAGPRESGSPGVYELTRNLITQLLTNLGAAPN